MWESTGNMEELARSKPIHRGDTVVVGRRATRTSANVNVEDDQNVALTILWVSSRRNGVCKQSRCGAYSNIRVMTERRRCGVSCLSTLCEIINQKLTNNALDLFLPPAQPQQHKRQNRKYADVYKPKGTLRLPLALVVAAHTICALPAMSESPKDVFMNCCTSKQRNTKNATHTCSCWIIQPRSYTAAAWRWKKLNKCEQGMVLRSVACIWILK